MRANVIGRSPSILLIDDKPDEVRGLAEQLRRQADVDIRHPQDVTNDDLFGADLVLIDYLIQVWAERDNAGSLALRPMNGLALAAVIRSHLTDDNEEDGTTHVGPTAIALHSAHLGLLSGGLPPEIRAHAVARANNLEWAFEKVEQNQAQYSLPDKIASLADAVRALPSAWPMEPDQVKELAKQFFELANESPWTPQAWADIEDCHPPIHELSTATHGLALLRWMLHRILPYPCFLFDSWYLAARLGINYAEFVIALEDEAFQGIFEPARYSGPLSEFLGVRWWRAGVESLLWTLTDGRSFDPKAIIEQLAEKSDKHLRGAELRHPIVCLDSTYAPLDEFCIAEESVRIQPDDWPPYAQQAWTKIDIALDNPLLNSLVIHEDRDRLLSLPPRRRDAEKAP